MSWRITTLGITGLTLGLLALSSQTYANPEVRQTGSAHAEIAEALGRVALDCEAPAHLESFAFEGLVQVEDGR